MLHTIAHLVEPLLSCVMWALLKLLVIYDEEECHSWGVRKISDTLFSKIEL